MPTLPNFSLQLTLYRKGHTALSEVGNRAVENRKGLQAHMNNLYKNAKILSLQGLKGEEGTREKEEVNKMSNRCQEDIREEGKQYEGDV